MGGKIDSDPSLNPILELLRDVRMSVKDMKKDFRDFGRKVDTMNRELGGVQVSLAAMRKESDGQDRQIENVRKVQSKCQAKAGIEEIKGRLNRLEDTNPAVPTHMSPVTVVKSNGIWKMALMKVVIPVFFAFAVGIGITAIIFWNFLKNS